MGFPYSPSNYVGPNPYQPLYVKPDIQPAAPVAPPAPPLQDAYRQGQLYQPATGRTTTFMALTTNSDNFSPGCRLKLSIQPALALKVPNRTSSGTKLFAFSRIAASVMDMCSRWHCWSHIFILSSSSGNFVSLGYGRHENLNDVIYYEGVPETINRADVGIRN